MDVPPPGSRRTAGCHAHRGPGGRGLRPRRLLEVQAWLMALCVLVSVSLMALVAVLAMRFGLFTPWVDALVENLSGVVAGMLALYLLLGTLGVPLVLGYQAASVALNGQAPRRQRWLGVVLALLLAAYLMLWLPWVVHIEPWYLAGL